MAISGRHYFIGTSHKKPVIALLALTRGAISALLRGKYYFGKHFSTTGIRLEWPAHNLVQAYEMLFPKQKSKYQSEITLFLQDLKKADPDLESKQFAGRALLWDKAPLSLDAQQRILDSTISNESH